MKKIVKKLLRYALCYALRYMMERLFEGKTGGLDAGDALALVPRLLNK